MSRKAAFGFLCVAFLLTGNSGAYGQLTKLEADPETTAWAVQSETGRVFAAVKSKGEVHEFDSKTGKRIRSIPVEQDPEHLLIKGNILAVACTKVSRMVLINLKNNKVYGTVQLKGKGPYALFCSKAANPYMYCICNSGDSSRDGEVFQIDMKRKGQESRGSKIASLGSEMGAH